MCHHNTTKDRVPVEYEKNLGTDFPRGFASATPWLRLMTFPWPPFTSTGYFNREIQFQRFANQGLYQGEQRIMDFYDEKLKPISLQSVQDGFKRLLPQFSFSILSRECG